MTLAQEMDRLIRYIDADIKLGMEHWDICADAASAFGLWDSNDSFPTWLSRIVEGQMRDTL